MIKSHINNQMIHEILSIPHKLGQRVTYIIRKLYKIYYKL